MSLDDKAKAELDAIFAKRGSHKRVRKTKLEGFLVDCPGTMEVGILEDDEPIISLQAIGVAFAPKATGFVRGSSIFLPSCARLPESYPLVDDLFIKSAVPISFMPMEGGEGRAAYSLMVLKLTCDLLISVGVDKVLAPLPPKEALRRLIFIESIAERTLLDLCVQVANSVEENQPVICSTAEEEFQALSSCRFYADFMEQFEQSDRYTTQRDTRLQQPVKAPALKKPVSRVRLYSVRLLIVLGFLLAAAAFLGILWIVGVVLFL